MCSDGPRLVFRLRVNSWLRGGALWSSCRDRTFQQPWGSVTGPLKFTTWKREGSRDHDKPSQTVGVGQSHFKQDSMTEISSSLIFDGDVPCHELTQQCIPSVLLETCETKWHLSVSKGGPRGWSAIAPPALGRLVSSGKGWTGPQCSTYNNKSTENWIICTSQSLSTITKTNCIMPGWTLNRNV